MTLNQSEPGTAPLLNRPSLPFQIKICGLTQPQQAIDAREAGADAIGLNFFEPSIRYVSAEKASLIAAAARRRALTATAPRLVGVFVNHSADRILELVTQLELDGVQLHGDETVEFFGDLKRLIEDKFGLKSCPFFVRALRTQPRGDSADLDHKIEIERIAGQIRAWSDAGIDTVLLDAAAPGEFGGTGKSIDWSLMPKLQAFARQPLALAGGLNPSNVADAIKTAQVNIVDAASGVESPKGVKCPEQIKRFVKQARTAFEAESRA